MNVHCTISLNFSSHFSEFSVSTFYRIGAFTQLTASKPEIVVYFIRGLTYNITHIANIVRIDAKDLTVDKIA